MSTTTIADPAKSLQSQLAADNIVNKYVWWSLGAGLIPFPYLDIAAISGAQIKMLADLANYFEVDGFHKERAKIIITSLVGGLLPGALAGGIAGSLLKMIPVVGSVIGGVTVPVFAGATTYALGRVFTQHFLFGGTFLDFDANAASGRFKHYVDEGKKVATEMGEKIKQEAETIAPKKQRPIPSA